MFKKFGRLREMIIDQYKNGEYVNLYSAISVRGIYVYTLPGLPNVCLIPITMKLRSRRNSTLPDISHNYLPVIQGSKEWTWLRTGQLEWAEYFEAVQVGFGVNFSIDGNDKFRYIDFADSLLENRVDIMHTNPEHLDLEIINNYIMNTKNEEKL